MKRIPVYPRAYNPDDPNPKKGRVRYTNPETLEGMGQGRDGFVSGVYLNLAIDSFAEEVTSQGRTAASKKISKMAEEILETSDYYVPVDEGDLAESGTVIESGVGADKEAQVRYRTRYALYVHEDLTKYHEPPTSAKFLEIAFLEVVGRHASTPMKSRFEMEVRTPMSKTRRKNKYQRYRNLEARTVQNIGTAPS